LRSEVDASFKRRYAGPLILTLKVVSVSNKY